MDAVKLGRLVMLVDVADGHEVDTGRPPIKLIDDLEIDPSLLDLGSAVSLIVWLYGDAAMLEFDFSVEYDVRRDRVGRHQHNTMGVESILPLATGIGVLKGTEFHFAVGAETESRNGGVHSQDAVVRNGGRRRCVARRRRGLAR